MSNWKEEYDKLILNGKFLEAEELCKKSIDPNKKIYKFFKGTNRNLNMIKDNKLWLSRGDCFNDPFDASFFVNRQSKDKYPYEEKDIAYKEYFEQKEQDKISLKMQHNSLITSFCERPDLILMWSYYAKDHKGFCVEYPLKDIMKKLTILPVVYSDNMLQIKEYTESNCKIGMLIKAKCWEHEKEWRIIEIADKDTLDKGKEIKNIPIPTTFYFGNRIWGNEKDNYESRKEYKVLCKEIEGKECNIKIGLPNEDKAVSIEQIMKYTEDNKIKLCGYELSRDKYELKEIRLIH